MMPDFLERWRKELPKLKDNLLAFLDEFSKRGLDERMSRMSEMHARVFEEIDCLKCANCCKTTPAILLNKDIKRMAAFLGIAPKIFRKRYVLEDINGELSFRKVPCVFLEANNYCQVYDFRPDSCRSYPHTAEVQQKTHTRLHKNNLEICPATFEIVKRLKKQ